jgi:antitoxin PrlF
MLTTVTTKGQVTIPKKIRDDLGIQPNDKLDFSQEEGKIIVTPVKTLKDYRGAVKAKGISLFEEERAKAKAAVAQRVMKEMK